MLLDLASFWKKKEGGILVNTFLFDLEFLWKNHELDKGIGRTTLIQELTD